MHKRWMMISLAVLLQSGALWAGGDGPSAAKTEIDGKPITLARYAKSFIGQGNIRVDIAPYTQAGGEGAILLFHGLEGDWDGKAINHSVETSSQGQTYKTSYKGKPWTTLLTRQSYDRMNYELYSPGTKDPIALSPSDGAAQLTSPQQIYKEYRAQNEADKKKSVTTP